MTENKLKRLKNSINIMINDENVLKVVSERILEIHANIKK